MKSCPKKFSSDEVRETVFSIGALKAPGKDGLSGSSSKTFGILSVKGLRKSAWAFSMMIKILGTIMTPLSL